MLTQLTYMFKQGEHDVSDIIRGKIQMLDEIIGMKHIFKKITDMELAVREEEEKQKGAR